jgi:hypothetical protein
MAANGTSPMGNGGEAMKEEGIGKCVENAMTVAENSMTEGSTEGMATSGNIAAVSPPNNI